MALPRKLKFTLLVDDEGGDEDYLNILNALGAIGEIVDEEEV